MSAGGGVKDDPPGRHQVLVRFDRTVAARKAAFSLEWTRGRVTTSDPEETERQLNTKLNS